MTQLDIDLSGVKTALTRLEREIELLQEHRTRLVADVVTGKLDVRAVAAKLPVEVEPAHDAVAEPEEDETETVEQTTE